MSVTRLEGLLAKLRCLAFQYSYQAKITELLPLRERCGVETPCTIIDEEEHYQKTTDLDRTHVTL